MSNVVFITIPEKGHIIPSLKLAKSLKSRGHRVYYLQLLKFAEYIRSQGLEFIPVFERCFPIEYEFCRHLATTENIRAQVEMEANACGITTKAFLKKEYGEIRDKLEAIPTHLIVQDRNSPMSCDELGAKIPYVILNPTLICPEYSEGDVDPIATNSRARPPMFILCPEQFDLPHSKRAAQLHYVEPSIDLDRNEQKFPWDQVRGDKQLIYCSLGTQSHWTYRKADHKETLRIRKNFLQAVINVIADNPEWELILWLGDYMSPQEFHSVPSNALLVNRGQQIEILEKASLMITNGGLGTVKECIYFGIPMVVYPLVGDHFKNADCVAYHQLGLKGDIENASERSIHSYISEVFSNPAFMHNMAKWKEMFRRAEGNGRLTDMVESVLAKG